MVSGLSGYDTPAIIRQRMVLYHKSFEKEIAFLKKTHFSVAVRRVPMKKHMTHASYAPYFAFRTDMEAVPTIVKPIRNIM